MKFTKIPFDKKLHILGGAIASIGTLTVLADWSVPRQTSVALGLILATLVAFFKEYYWDKKYNGTVEKLDVAYTMFGAILSTIIYEIARHYLHS